MSWSALVFYCISISCGAMILRVWRSPKPRPMGWMWISVGVLCLTWVLNGFMSMVWAARIGGLVWGLLVLAPSLGIRWLHQLLSTQRFQAAYEWALWVRLLHPFDGWWGLATLLKALQLTEQGQHAAAEQIIKRYDEAPTALACQAIASYYLARKDWQGLLDWVDGHRQLHVTPVLMAYYCRALGETGQVERLLERLEKPQLRKLLLDSNHRFNWTMVLLFAAAFSGQVETADYLLTKQLTPLSPKQRKFWQAIAYYTAGDKVRGKLLLEKLQAEPGNISAQAIQRYRQDPPRRVRLSSKADPQLEQLARLVQREAQERQFQSIFGTKAAHSGGVSVNQWLITINCLVFVGAIALGHVYGPEALLEWGGLAPRLVQQGEWWRLLSAGFIHAGLLHLSMNMVSLWLLGPFAEKHLGALRYLAVYLGSGLAAKITLFTLVIWAQGFPYDTMPAWLSFLTNEIRYDYQIWVGASGSIMGMIGAIAVVLWQGWRQLGLDSARRQFSLVGIMIVIQFMADLSTPNVSFYSHSLGLIWGIMLTALLLPKLRPFSLGQSNSH